MGQFITVHMQIHHVIMSKKKTCHLSFDYNTAVSWWIFKNNFSIFKNRNKQIPYKKDRKC